MSITPQQAEELAKKFVGDYLTACQMQVEDRELIGNLLMKLVSVAGVLMANAEGSEVAALRLEGTANFIMDSMPKHPSKLERMQ